MKLAVIDAFTYHGAGGNAAGVVITDNYLSDMVMQNIAYKANMSETAFIVKKDNDNYDVRFFTPKCEVDLCGHASIASFYYIGMSMITNGCSKKTVYQNTKSGRLSIEINFKDDKVDYVTMQQATPKIYREIGLDKKKELADSLNLRTEDVGLSASNINPTIVSTGLKDIIIPVRSRDILNNIHANMKLITDISKENDVVGYHVFTIDGDYIYARNFAPLVGIDEECATGTSNGSLAYLLYTNKLINSSIRVIQGESMKKESLIYADIRNYNNQINVMVGGTATLKKIYDIDIN